LLAKVRKELSALHYILIGAYLTVFTMRVIMFNLGSSASGIRLAFSLLESLGIEIVFIMRNVFIFEMMKVASLLISKD
jgi:hypothetical protein